MTIHSALDVPSFPMRRGCPFSLPAEYRDMRTDAPVTKAVLRNGTPVWLVSRYQDVTKVLTDPAISSDRSKPGFPFLSDEAEYLAKARVFVGMDPPEHGPNRRMFLPEFTNLNIRAIRPLIESAVADRLDAMVAAGPPSDLVRDLALPVPAAAIGRILGVPTENFAEFNSLTVGLMTTSDGDESGRLFGRLVEFMKALVRTKRDMPGSDLTSRVIADHVKTGELELRTLTIVLILILLAGYETTANAISLGVATLLREPRQLDLVMSDRSLMRGAVDEVLRYHSVAELATVRVATQDIEVAGTLIKAGEAVIPLTGSANHDPEKFDDPDTFDVLRRTTGHLAFGYGPHACLGANLARLEMGVVFERLFDRFPTLSVVEPEAEYDAKYDAILFGLGSLNVTW